MTKQPDSRWSGFAAADPEPEPVKDELDEEQALNKSPDEVLRRRRLMPGASRARFANMSDYWIAEGHRTLRFHSGDCYMKTPGGAFQQHRGVPPAQGELSEL